MNQFKFGDLVKSRAKPDKRKGVVVANGSNQYSVIVRWEHETGGVSQEHVESLELISHPDTERLMYLVENEKLVLLDDDGAWSIVNAIPEYYNGNRRLSRKFDFRHAIDKAMEMEKENDTRPSTQRN